MKIFLRNITNKNIDELTFNSSEDFLNNLYLIRQMKDVVNEFEINKTLIISIR